MGRSAERRVVISEDLVRRFADLVDDHNPIHLDTDVARQSRFGERVAHGMLIGSLFSGLIAEELPGPGSIYLSQTLQFRRPTLLGSEVLAVVQCVSASGRRATLVTTAMDDIGQALVEGEAVVLVPEP